MFTLLITLIAIALVAALALTSLYYGGSVYNEGASRAQAAKLDAQSQQIMGAMELFHAETGAYPETLDDLVSQQYLKSIPVAMLDAPNGGLSNAQAATTTWTLAGPYSPVIVLAPVSVATCEAFNKAQYGQAGVLKSLRGAQLKQCVGTDVNNLMIVTAKSTADLVAVSANPSAAINIGTVVSAAIPAGTSTDTSLNGWLLPPGNANSFSYLNSSGVALSSLAFADTKLGETSEALVVTIKNTGTSSLNFTSSGATVGLPFAISANACASAVLAPNASCNIAVTFTPSEAKLYTGGSYALSIQTTNLTAGNLPLAGTGISVVAVSGLLPTGSQGSVLYHTTTAYQRTAAESLAYPGRYPYDSSYYSQYKYVPSPVKLDYYGAVVDGVTPVYDPYRVRVMTSNHYYTVDTPYYDDEHPLLYTNAAPLNTYSGPIHSTTQYSWGPLTYVTGSTELFPINGQDIVHVGVNEVFKAHPYFRPDWIIGEPQVSFQYTKEITAVNVANLPNRSNGLVDNDVCWSANPGDISVKFPEFCADNFSYAGVSEGAHSDYYPPVPVIPAIPYTLSNIDFGSVSQGTNVMGTTMLTNATSLDSPIILNSANYNLTFNTLSSNCLNGVIKAYSACVYDVSYNVPSDVTSDTATISFTGGRGSASATMTATLTGLILSNTDISITGINGGLSNIAVVTLTNTSKESITKLEISTPLIFYGIVYPYYGYRFTGLEFVGGGTNHNCPATLEAGATCSMNIQSHGIRGNSRVYAQTFVTFNENMSKTIMITQDTSQ